MDQAPAGLSHFCSKCETLHFKNVNDVAPGRDVYPRKDEAEEPFREVWADVHNVGLPYLLPIYDSIDELEQSALNGCHFCLQILYSFTPDDVTDFHLSNTVGSPGRKVWLEYREAENGARRVIFVSYHRTIGILELLPRGE